MLLLLCIICINFSYATEAAHLQPLDTARDAAAFTRKPCRIDEESLRQVLALEWGDALYQFMDSKENHTSYPSNAPYHFAFDAFAFDAGFGGFDFDLSCKYNFGLKFRYEYEYGRNSPSSNRAGFVAYCSPTLVLFRGLGARWQAYLLA